MRAAGFFLALLLVAPVRAAEVPDFKTTAHTVAIVSLIGDTINEGDAVVPAAGAGFDDTAEQAMARQIRADLPGVSVVRLGGPRDPLLTLMYPDHGFGDVGMKQVREALKRWAAAHPVDYIVILRKTAGMIEWRDLGHSMSTKYYTFGIGLLGGRPEAFVNLTVCDGTTLEIVGDLSARDENWGSREYTFKNGKEQIPALTADIQAMLASVVPGLVHGVGL